MRAGLVIPCVAREVAGDIAVVLLPGRLGVEAVESAEIVQSNPVDIGSLTDSYDAEAAVPVGTLLLAASIDALDS